MFTWKRFTLGFFEKYRPTIKKTNQFPSGWGGKNGFCDDDEGRRLLFWNLAKQVTSKRLSIEALHTRASVRISSKAAISNRLCELQQK